MIYLKTPEEIALLRASNQLVGKTLGEMAKHIRPGISTLELDRIAEDFIRSHGALPAFKGYEGFPNALCVSVNDVVVHGIPSAKCILKEGDVVSIDCGTKLDGFCGDSCYTFCVGEVSDDVKHLLKTTKESLYKAIQTSIVGRRIGDIGYTVQQYCESQGYGIVREFVGHGIGRELHEDPEVPNYRTNRRGHRLAAGMAIAIEPMVNQGTDEISLAGNKWTVYTKDGKLSAHYENTVIVTDDEPLIVTL